MHAYTSTNNKTLKFFYSIHQQNFLNSNNGQKHEATLSNRGRRRGDRGGGAAGRGGDHLRRGGESPHAVYTLRHRQRANWEMLRRNQNSTQRGQDDGGSAERLRLPEKYGHRVSRHQLRQGRRTT